MSFLLISKTLRLNNLKTRTAMNTKISVLVICVEEIICLLLYSLLDFTFDIASLHVFRKLQRWFRDRARSKIITLVCEVCFEYVTYACTRFVKACVILVWNYQKKIYDKNICKMSRTLSALKKREEKKQAAFDCLHC